MIDYILLSLLILWTVAAWTMAVAQTRKDPGFKEKLRFWKD